MKRILNLKAFTSPSCQKRLRLRSPIGRETTFFKEKSFLESYHRYFKKQESLMNTYVYKMSYRDLTKVSA